MSIFFVLVSLAARDLLACQPSPAEKFMCVYGADNIVLMSDYYAKRTLTFILGERDPLLQAFRKRKASDSLEDAA